LHQLLFSLKWRPADLFKTALPDIPLFADVSSSDLKFLPEDTNAFDPILVPDRRELILNKL